MLIDRVEEAARYVADRRFFQPQVAIILGSGLGGLVGDIVHATSLSYDDIPHFESTNAVGHAGQLVLGYLSGMPVVVMQGRYHRYEGHAHETVCFPVRVMKALGANTLLVTNAAGGLNPRFRPGDLMLVDQHINCLWPRLSHSQPADLSAQDCDCLTRGPGQMRSSQEQYDHDLQQRIVRIALRSEIALQRGTYVATLGPTYETRAEYRMFRWMGGDAVGMSTVPEVLTARQLGMQVQAISVITNVAATDSAEGTSHEEVVAWGRQAEPKLRRIVGQLLEDLAGPPD